MADPRLSEREGRRAENEAEALATEVCPAVAEGVGLERGGSPSDKETPLADKETDCVETGSCTAMQSPARLRRRYVFWRRVLFDQCARFPPPRAHFCFLSGHSALAGGTFMLGESCFALGGDTFTNQRNRSGVDGAGFVAHRAALVRGGAGPRAKVHACARMHDARAPEHDDIRLKSGPRETKNGG